MTAPERDYDDYAGVDVKGKIVASLIGAPPSFPSGQRAYYATRILLQNGFKARNVAGGMLSRSHAVST